MRFDTTTLATLDKAAGIRGISRADFVRQAALAEAERVVNAHSTTRLSLEASAAFLEALDNPPKPSPALTSLLKKAKDAQRR